MTELFDQLCNPDTLELGWHMAHMDCRSDFITDSLGYIDYAHNRQQRLRFISDQIRGDRYRPRRNIPIDVPKSGLAVRPGDIIHIEDCTVLHSLLYLIAPLLDPHISDEVYSYRLATDWKKRAKRANRVFSFTRSENVPFLKNKTLQNLMRTDPWFYTWPEFDSRASEAITSLGYTHLTLTDISAYFENIDLDLLENLIHRMLPGEPDLISFFMKFYRNWSKKTFYGNPIGRGIPQGSDVSSFLGNIYLTPLDEALTDFCVKTESLWYRYMDDIKLFTKNYDNARAGVFLINENLRKLSLNIQGAKTKILSGPELQNEISDPELDAINKCIKDIEPLTKIGDRSGTTRMLSDVNYIITNFTTNLPNSVANLSGRENRLFRRCLTLYGSCYRARLKKAAFTAITHMPDTRILKSSLGYFRKLPYRYHDEIVEKLLLSIEDNDLLFPYQIATVLDSLRFFHPSNSNGIASRIRKIGFSNKATHWAIQQKAAEAISLLPYPKKHIARVSGLCLDSLHPPVKRAGMLLYCRRDVEEVRQGMKSRLSDPDPDISRIAAHWNECITNKEFALKELDRHKSAYVNDDRFMRAIPQLYAIRCNGDMPTIRKLKDIISNRVKTKSPRVRWHCNELQKLTNFA